MKRPILIFAIIFLSISCYNPGINWEYEVDSRNAANFSLECYLLYPNEEIQVSVNNELLFKTKSNKDHYNLRKYFFYPAGIERVQVSGFYEGKVIYARDFSDTLTGVSKLNLFISMPYPKGMIIPSDPQWRPGWTNIPIDSVDRIIILEPDTLLSKIQPATGQRR